MPLASMTDITEPLFAMAAIEMPPLMIQADAIIMMPITDTHTAASFTAGISRVTDYGFRR